ncbi:HTH-type transcriptional repressor RspR [Baekduia alba]|uniref:GntR family transcriptional regulator n=1 Tax=Baekduia alba TaxID=2997333 RepID=UPI002340975F|nr:GntR family transcriptional regulator [Baekduia alba]WCB95331.1 HTH-type transcriptional repressor RspR [Baekduia alba]
MPSPTRARDRAAQPAAALKDQAFATLRALILNGDLAAGSFISERQMVERLGMSKTPIRVAFERLAQDGFVEILPQRGVRVRGLSGAEVADHYDLRIALETWVARRAAERQTPAAITALEERIAAQERLRRKVGRAAKRTDAGDVTTYIDEDAQFHATLASLAGNAEIERVLANQRERLARIVAQHIRDDPPLLVASIAEHREILDRVAAGDGQRAAQAMERHLERGRDALLAA